MVPMSFCWCLYGAWTQRQFFLVQRPIFSYFVTPWNVPFSYSAGDSLVSSYPVLQSDAGGHSKGHKLMDGGHHTSQTLTRDGLMRAGPVKSRPLLCLLVGHLDSFQATNLHGYRYGFGTVRGPFKVSQHAA